MQLLAALCQGDAGMMSMTGYGRSQQQTAGREVLVEIKSVNHKFLESTCRVPKGYGFLEERLRAYLQEHLSRGKVDVTVSMVSNREGDAQVTLNRGVAAGYLNALRQLGQEQGLEDDLTLSSLAAYPDLFTVTPVAEDEGAVWEVVRPALEHAMEGFLLMRQREGHAMQADLAQRVAALTELVGQVEQRSAETVEEYRSRLEARLREILGSTDWEDARILTEAALFAEKTAVAEETVRLRSHLAQMTRLMQEPAPSGRRLDFLAQEMNREANTIASKAMDAPIAHLVVEMKAEIEKIREQVQNIE